MGPDFAPGDRVRVEGYDSKIDGEEGSVVAGLNDGEDDAYVSVRLDNENLSESVFTWLFEPRELVKL